MLTSPHGAEKLHTTRSAAKKLNISPHTLPVWRRRGIGPAWVQYGPKTFRYFDADLDRYLAERRCAPVSTTA
jgi:DNA-binding transcriptional MerR regulator